MEYIIVLESVNWNFRVTFKTGTMETKLQDEQNSLTWSQGLQNRN